MNKNLLKSISEDILKILKIKSIMLISENGLNPKYIIKYFDDTIYSFNQQEYTEFNKKLIKSIRKMKLQKLI